MPACSQRASCPPPPLLASGLGACGPFLSRPFLFAVQGGGLETVCLQADYCCRRCHLCSAAQHHRAPSHRCCACRRALAPLPCSFLIRSPLFPPSYVPGSSLPGPPAGLHPMTDSAPGGIGPTGPGGQVGAPEGAFLSCANELAWGRHKERGSNVGAHGSPGAPVCTGALVKHSELLPVSQDLRGEGVVCKSCACCSTATESGESRNARRILRNMRLFGPEAPRGFLSAEAPAGGG